MKQADCVKVCIYLWSKIGQSQNQAGRSKQANLLEKGGQAERQKFTRQAGIKTGKLRRKHIGQSGRE